MWLSGRRLVQSDLERLWKEAGGAKYEVLLWRLRGRTEENHKKCQCSHCPSQDVDSTHTEFSSRKSYPQFDSRERQNSHGTKLS